MKLVAAWIVVLGVAALVGGSCSINHRSGDYTCTTSADCATGRVCDNGLCVVSGADIDAPGSGSGSGSNHIDAPRPIDAYQCPEECTHCDPTENVCIIDCGGGSATTCQGLVTCPAGWDCTINCSAGNACRGGIDCTQGNSCAITCSGPGSCRSDTPISCGTAPCKVACTGSNSCHNIDCSDSCACDVSCANASGVCFNISCATQGGTEVCGQFFGQNYCDSSSPGCNTCQ